MPEEALDWLKRAAEAGWAHAGIYLGHIFDSPKFKCRSLEESEKYFRTAFGDESRGIAARGDVAELYLRQARYSEAVDLLEDGFGFYLECISTDLKKPGRSYKSIGTWADGYIQCGGWRIADQIIRSDTESMSRLMDFMAGMEDDPRWNTIVDLLKDWYPKDESSVAKDMLRLYPHVNHMLKKEITDFLGGRRADS